MSYFNLTLGRQVTVLAVALCAFFFVAYVGLRFQHFGHVVLSRNHMLADADREKGELSQQIEALRDTLAEAESRAESVGEDNDQLMARLTAVQQRVAVLESQRDQAVAEAAKQFKQRDAARSKALADAQQEIAQLDAARAKLQTDRGDIEEKLAGAHDKLNAKSSNLVALSKELDKKSDLLRHSDSNQVALQTRIQALEKELADANLHTVKYKSDLAAIQNKLDSLQVERDKLVARRDNALTSPLPETTAPRSSAADTGKAESIARAEPIGKTAPVAARTALPLRQGSGSKIEALIASTGLDVHKLLSDGGESFSRAEGGPFVPLGDATQAGAEARRHRLLDKLMETLPLRAPLDHYWVASPFGPRRDPFNHRRGFHTGVDLAAPYRTHVFSTAPGIVIFAGAEGGWGRLVEIDHGHGIVTRYAHMHRIFVVRGQKVPAGYAIGELGSTGRSTGPHVHYEIVVDGTAVDPAKFLGAGDNVVQVGAKQ
ncbi:MAG TPA: peptidoglycan DD-metalloendopeptidase family protein [Stellaceae bacterium]|nr:peptidoglycan DD-metalloendopeptidase family protein [Stellaceae bacterium]